jgi:hypothetical protein
MVGRKEAVVVAAVHAAAMDTTLNIPIITSSFPPSKRDRPCSPLPI